MSSLLIIVFIVSVCGLAVVGLISNGFIAAMTIVAWAKCGSLSTCEQLLLSLAVCNVCFTASYTPYAFIVSMPSSLDSSVTDSIVICCAFATISRFWLTTLLCIFYCIKIVNSSHFIFLWWKLRISRLMPWLLGGSTVISFSFSFSMKGTLQIQSYTAANITSVAYKQETGSQHTALIITALCSPLLVVLICCFLTVASLCRHVFRMTGEGRCFSSPQMKAHFKAAGTVASLLLLYISFYVVNIILLNQFSKMNPISLYVCFDVLMVYAPVQAAILVLVNPKLKQPVARVLLRTKHLCSSAT